MTNLHTVMDYYSNEFMRLENFLEKYLPLKVLNLLSKALNYTIEHKYKWKLKDWEDQTFVEMRERLLEDSGLPDMEKECKSIISTAKQQSVKFKDYDTLASPDIEGFANDRLIKHKHFAILNHNQDVINLS